MARKQRTFPAFFTQLLAEARAEPRKVYLMEAEHYYVPGRVVRICATRELAVKEALACVNVMLSDDGSKPVDNEEAMQAALTYLRANHDGDCYAEITEHEVLR